MVQTAMASERVLSVDVLRGITIAFMILVNDPGDWRHVYPQLDHAEWNGWTATDLVFPTFLFLIGVSLVFSVEARLARGESRAAIAGNMARRAAILFGLKLLMSLYPHFHFGHLRLFGVLTRIALCSLVAGLVCLMTRRLRWLGVLVVVLLVGYWALLRFVPVPGFGVPGRDVPLLDEVGNLTSWIDRGFTAWTQRWLHVGSLYRKTSDPEGLLSTLPSVATVLIGAMAGVWMRRDSVPAATRATGMTLAGVLAVVAGQTWGESFPINKNLWTSSYVLFAAGLALLVLELCAWLVDQVRVQDRSWLGRAAVWPWLVFGSNAIVAYILSEFFVETLSWLKVPDGRNSISAWNWMYLHVFSRGQSTERTSLAFAVAYVAVCFVPNWFLWRRKLFLKI